MPIKFRIHSAPKVTQQRHDPRPREKRAQQVNRQRARTYHTGSAAWRRIRRFVLERDQFTCGCCGKFGDQVDHLDGDATNNPEDGSNWGTKCRPCHSRKTRAEQSGAVQILPKSIPSPAARVRVVCGPPGAGKTTWAQQHAAGALVLDVDAIAASLGFGRDRPDQATRWALRERNRMLAEAVAARRPVVLVTTAGTQKQREFWAQWGAEVKVLHPGDAVCIERVMRDPERTDEIRQQHVAVIQNWR